jgi:hypothetical protein
VRDELRVLCDSIGLVPERAAPPRALEGPRYLQPALPARRPLNRRKHLSEEIDEVRRRAAAGESRASLAAAFDMWTSFELPARRAGVYPVNGLDGATWFCWRE